MIGVGTFQITDKAKKYVNEVLDAERLSYGPFMKKFETAFAASHQCRFAIMSNSGTSSLMVALAALKNKYGWQDGDEVIVPAVTFIATSNIVLQNNMKPVFVDVDPIYYEINPQLIEKAITAKTRCIIPVHLFGHPCDMDPIMDIANKYELRVIEDSCETMFVNYRGRSVGSFGDIGCFSTYVAHILTTGIGGLCTTNSPDLAINIRSLINHGRDSIYLNIDDDNDKSPEEMQMIIQKRFSFVQMGYSFRASELEGAIGLAEWERREEMMKKRWENGQYLIRGLSSLKDFIQLPSIREDSGHSFMMFPIVLRHEPKVKLVQFLEEKGIETRDMLPLINQPYYRKIFPELKQEDYPVAKWINENGFYIASHHGLSELERDYIIENLHQYFLNQSCRTQDACLVIFSKISGTVTKTSLELFYQALPMDIFKDKIIVDNSHGDQVKSFFQKQDFKYILSDKGKGEALHEAIKNTSCENIIMIGIDGADDPNDLNRILIKLRNGQELVVASRFVLGGKRQDKRPFSFHSIGNRFFTFLLNVIYDVNITDCNNLLRGIKKSAYEKFNLREKGENLMFEMTIKAIKHHLKIDEIPTVEKVSHLNRKKRNRLLSAFSFFGILLGQVFQPVLPSTRDSMDKK